MPTLRRRGERLSTTRNTLWLTGCRLTGDVLNLMLFVLISRTYGPAGVGAYSYGFAVATFGFVIGCLGIEEYGLRQYARTEAAQRPAFLGELLGTQALMVAAAVVSLAAYLLVTRPSPATLFMVCVLGVYQITASVVATLFIPAMADQRMLWPALAELSARAVAFAVAGYAIYVQHAPLALALIGFPVAAVIWFSLGVLSVRRFAPLLRLTISGPGTRRILKILWSFALLEIFAQLFARVGVISLSLGVGDAAAGLFATGLRLIEVALMPLSFLGVAAYPGLSRLYATDPAGIPPSGGRSHVADAARRRRGGLGPVLRSAARSWCPRSARASPAPSQSSRPWRCSRWCKRWKSRSADCCSAPTARPRPRASWPPAPSSALILNLLWVPRYGINGAIYAGAAAYAAIDLLGHRRIAPAPRRRRARADAAHPSRASLAVGSRAGRLAGAARCQRVNHPGRRIPRRLRRCMAALAYRFRHGTGGRGLSPPGTAT
jgi:hypothetical protein